MSLTRAIRETATARNRERQRLAELRLEEQIKVAGIADDYGSIDRRGDLEMETHFARMFHAAVSDEMRGLITRAFEAWQRTEQAEERNVIESVRESVSFLRDNTPAFTGEVPAWRRRSLVKDMTGAIR